MEVQEYIPIDSYEEQTKVKHKAFKEYYKNWVKILGKWNPTVNYIDGFAGSGIYKDKKNKLHFGSPLIAAVMVKKKTKVLKIESLTADPTGTKGALAKAIYTMPDSLFIYKKAVWLASLELGYDVQLETVRSYYTSTLHYQCGGSLIRQKGQYDIAPCKKCGKQVNTHVNAALNIAFLKGTFLSPDSFPSSHA